MNSNRSPEDHGGWEHLADAGQHFARRVARDASRFAERLEEHTTDFAREMSHEWRRARRTHRRAQRAPDADVRQVFDDVRTVLADIIDGVDEFVERIFREPRPTERTAAEPSEPAEATWTQMVSNRMATCGACGRTVEPGQEGFFRQAEDGISFRCVDCGISTGADE